MSLADVCLAEASRKRASISLPGVQWHCQCEAEIRSGTGNARQKEQWQPSPTHQRRLDIALGERAARSEVFS
jgi:hypothetical protein